MIRFLVLLAALAGLPAVAATPPSSVRLARFHTQLEADGRSVQTFRFEYHAATDAAAQQMAQQSWSFTEGMERIELSEGYTLKADGRRIPVAPEAIRVQLAPGTPSVPEYSDRKQVTAIFPAVAAGDSIVLTWTRTVLQTPIPGIFANTNLFSRTLAWDDAEVTISAPAGMPLATEQHGPALTVSVQGDGRTLYRWAWAAPAAADDPAALAGVDRLPRIFVSSAPGWERFGRDYAALVEPKLAVTPRLRALAEEVTAGVTDRREQARLLYEWVSRNVRWVAIYVGNGGYEPHAADHTLGNRYGDCKDQVVLLVALLRAVGITAEPALVNLGPSYTLSGPATYSAFNHVVTYLPDWDLYADTTAGGAPFGTVPWQEYGKPTVHAVAEGPPLRRIPAAAVGAVTRVRTVARLSATGGVVGESVTETAGYPTTSLRSVVRQAQSEGAERAAIRVLQNRGLVGGGAFALPAGKPMGIEDRLAGRFTLEEQPGWLDGDGFALPAGLRVLGVPGDGVIGPLGQRNLPATEATPCGAGVQEEDVSLALPEGWRPAYLPRARRIVDEAFEYSSTWSFEGGALRVRRRMESRVEGPVCDGALRVRAARALAEIRREQDVRVVLERQ